MSGMTLKQAAQRAEALTEAQPEPTGEIDTHLTWLNDHLGAMSKADKIAWMEAELAQCGEGYEAIVELLEDWIDFLRLQDDPRKDTIKRNPQLDRWGEIMGRWSWACWTGYGLPPQLSPGHWLYIFKE